MDHITKLYCETLAVVHSWYVDSLHQTGKAIEREDVKIGQGLCQAVNRALFRAPTNILEDGVIIKKLHMELDRTTGKASRVELCWPRNYVYVNQGLYSKVKLNRDAIQARIDWLEKQLSFYDAPNTQG